MKEKSRVEGQPWRREKKEEKEAAVEEEMAKIITKKGEEN